MGSSRTVTEAKGKVFWPWRRNTGLHRSKKKRDTLPFGHKFSFPEIMFAYYCTVNTEKDSEKCEVNIILFICDIESKSDYNVMFHCLFCSSLSSPNTLNTRKYCLLLWKQLDKLGMSLLKFQKNNRKLLV